MLKGNKIKKIILFAVVFLTVASLIKSQDVVISPSPLYMGKIPLGSLSEREIILFNTTVSSVSVNSISITGTDAALFEVVDNPGSLTLGPIERRGITIRYTPAAAAENVAIFQIETSSGNFTDSLTAFGIPSSGGVQSFERILGTSEDDGGSNIKHTADGGYVIAGKTIPRGEEYNSVYLLKTDANGLMQWNAVYGDEDNPDTGSDVEQTDDGGYLLLGNTDNWGEGGTDLMLVKFNSAGEFQWRKTYGTINNDQGSRMVKTLDGGYALVGQTVPSSGIGKSIFLVKVSADGTEQWRQTYGGADGADASDIIELSDGSLVIVGFISTGDDFNVNLIKVSSGGELIWQKSYGGPEWDVGRSVAEIPGEGFIICGYTASMGNGARDGYLLKVNTSGDLVWEKAYGFVNSDAFGGVVVTPDGGFLAVGNSVVILTLDHTYTDAYIVKTDADGNEIWGRLYGGDLSDGFGEIYKANDGGYIVLGYSSSYGKSDDIYLMKIGESGIVSDVNDDRNEVINDFHLFQNYPNPFNPKTTISFQLTETGYVDLKVFDLLGREVSTLLKEEKPAGLHHVKFNAGDMPSGIYFYRVKTENHISTKKMILLK